MSASQPIIIDDESSDDDICVMHERKKNPNVVLDPELIGKEIFLLGSSGDNGFGKVVRFKRFAKTKCDTKGNVVSTLSLDEQPFLHGVVEK